MQSPNDLSQSSRASTSKLICTIPNKAATHLLKDFLNKGVKWLSPWQTLTFLRRPVSRQGSLIQHSISWRARRLCSHGLPICPSAYAAREHGLRTARWGCSLPLYRGSLAILRSHRQLIPTIASKQHCPGDRTLPATSQGLRPRWQRCRSPTWFWLTLFSTLSSFWANFQKPQTERRMWELHITQLTGASMLTRTEPLPIPNKKIIIWGWFF